MSEEIADWNPFHEPHRSEPLSEDQFFGAEFDKIRRGSQSSKFHLLLQFCQLVICRPD